MKETLSSQRYARALFEAVNEKAPQDLENVRKGLREMAAVLRDAKTHALVDNPLKPAAEKRAAFGDTFKKGANGMLANFLNLMIAKKRISILPQVLREFESLIEKKSGRGHALVQTARALSDAQKAEIERTLSKIAGKEVLVTPELHPELLAGVVIRYGDWILDNSLQTRLQKMKERVGE